MKQTQGFNRIAGQIDASYITGLILFSGLFLVFPYWNGLFFHPSFSFAAIYLFGSLVFLSLWWNKKGVRVSGWSTVDYLAGGVVLAYLFAAFSPADYEQAIIGAFRYAAYFGLYILVRVLLGGGVSRMAFLRVFAVSGTLVALYGLANGFGTLHRAGAIFDGRLSSSFEYPNAAASYVVVAMLLTLGLMAASAKKFEKLAYSAGLYAMLAFIVYSYSRGAWLVLGAMLILMLPSAPKGFKTAVAAHVLVPLVAYLGTAKWLGEAIKSQQQAKGWLVLAAGILLAAGLAWIAELLRSRIQFAVGQKFKWAAVAAAVAAVAVLAVFANKLIPQSVWERMASINLEQFSVVQRFTFYKDGFAAFLDNPVFGNGYGTWKSSVYSFQSYPYISTQAHGFLLDVLLDVGTVGLLLLLGFLIYGIRLWWRNYRNDASGENRMVLQAILFAGAALIGHALIDFDMAYGAINFLLWTLLALAVGPLSVSTPAALAQTLKRGTGTRKLWYSTAVASFAGLIGMAGFAASEHFLKAAYAEGVDPKTGLRKAEAGAAFAPYRANLWMAKAQYADALYGPKPNNSNQKNKNDQSTGDEIRKAGQKAASLAPYDAKTVLQAAGYSAKAGDGAAALALARQAWEHGKFNQQALEFYMNISQSAGTQYYEKNKQEAKRQFENGWLAFQDAEQKIQGFAALPKVLRLEYQYEITPSIRVYAALCAYYLGKYDDAERVLAPVLEGADKPTEEASSMAKLLANVIKQKKGQPVNEKEVKAITAKKKDYEKIYQSLLQVQPI